MPGERLSQGHQKTILCKASEIKNFETGNMIGSK